MKILYIASPGWGGANISLALLVQRLKKMGVCAKIIVANKEYIGFFESYGIDVEYVPVKFMLWPDYDHLKNKIAFFPRVIMKLWYTHVYSFLKIRNIAKSFNPDIIHTNVSCFTAGHLVANSLSIPHIYHVREYGNLDFGWNLFPSFKKYSNRLQQTYSIAITKDIAKHFNLTTPSNRVIYNGIADELIEQQDYFTKGFLYVGYITENKGFSELLNAYCDYVTKGGRTKLFVVGSGDDKYLSLQKDYLEKHQCSEMVVFLGRRSNINQIMAAAKAIVVCSKNEGFGRITAEAMFNKCLVIGKNTGGTKEQFDNGLEISGKEIGVRFLNTEDLTDSLFRVDFMSDQERNEIITNALNTVTKLYTLENCANNVLGFYSDIVNRNKN